MGRTSQKFDRQLLTLKLSKPARQMQIESLASYKAAWSAELAGSALIRIVDGQLAVLRNWLETLDRICREVWQTQGETITPEFVREILMQEAMTAIGARVGVTNSHVNRAAGHTHEDPHGAQHHLAMEVNRLKAEVNNRYEIEARELEYRDTESDPAGWRSRGEKCKQFAIEETQIIRATRKEHLLADCHFANSSPTFDKESALKLREGPDSRLRVEFETWATKAGIALGSPKGASPLRFWLYRLFLYLYKTKSPHLFAPESSYTVGPNPQSELLKPQAGETVFMLGGIITNVWEASAIFCVWLEKLALETVQNNGIATQKAENVTNRQRKPLSGREKQLLEVIQRGLKGRAYCRELDNAHIPPRKTGVWRDCARKYVAAYDLGGPWRHRIEDEKNKIKRKAEA